jgi:hypothetical protein
VLPLTKARKKKTTKKSAAGKRKTTGAKRRAATTGRRKSSRRPRRKPAKGLVGKVSSAVSVVIDTIKGTDALRNKLEPPATSEVE